MELAMVEALDLVGSRLKKYNLRGESHPVLSPLRLGEFRRGRVGSGRIRCRAVW